MFWTRKSVSSTLRGCSGALHEVRDSAIMGKDFSITILTKNKPKFEKLVGRLGNFSCLVLAWHVKNKICHILKHSLEHFFKPTHIWLPVEFYYYIILLWWLTKILHFAYRTPLHNWLEIGKKVPIRNFSVSQFFSIMIILISVQLTVYLLNRVNAISVL